MAETDLPAGGGSETFVTEFDFDVLNRVTERREIDRLSGQNVLTTLFGYDSRSNLTWRVDAEGHPVRWTYDLASRLVLYERALSVGQQIDQFLTQIDEAFAYDGNDRLTSLTDDNFHSTAYQYDARDRPTRTPTRTTATWRTVYDASAERRGVDGPERDGGSEHPRRGGPADGEERYPGERGARVDLRTVHLRRPGADAHGQGRRHPGGEDLRQRGEPASDRQGWSVQGQERWKTVGA